MPAIATITNVHKCGKGMVYDAQPDDVSRPIPQNANKSRKNQHLTKVNAKKKSHIWSIPNKSPRILSAPSPG
jgi:hypothetical protein